MTEPENSLTKQYQELLATDGVSLEFREDGVQELAQMAYAVNQETQNIGARRLHTVMERLLEDVLYNAPEVDEPRVVVDAAYVKAKMSDLMTNKDVSRYIL